MKISFEKLEKKYGTSTALNKVSAVLLDGSFTVILGPSGSGKTTLLRLVAGLTYPTSGKVLFDNEDITNKPPRDRNVALVFQNFPLFPHMTVEENLRFSLENQKFGKVFKKRVYSNKVVDEKVNEVLDMLQIEEHKYKYPNQMSGGEQQRVAIGREVIRDPRVFLFDEPLSNIDARLRYEMRTWIRKIHKMLKKTMIYVTHDQNEAMTLGDIIVLLKEGEIEQMGKPEELYFNPKTKFVATFIGNYPMNFLPFEVKQNEICISGTSNVINSDKICEKIENLNLKKGEIAFRAESIREFDKDKLLEESMLLLKCKVTDIEKLLELQILTLNIEKFNLIYVTKTKKEFNINDNISVIIHSDEIYYFNSEGVRVK